MLVKDAMTSGFVLVGCNSVADLVELAYTHVSELDPHHDWKYVFTQIGYSCCTPIKWCFVVNSIRGEGLHGHLVRCA